LNRAKSVKSECRLKVEIHGASLCMALLDSDALKFPKSLTIADNIEVRDDGRWIFKGRLDLTINRGGMKIALEDVERVIREKLEMTIVAYGIPSERLGEDLAVAVESHADDVTALISEHYKVKAQVVVLEKLPLNASGKIDRKKISEIANANMNAPMHDSRLPVSQLLDFLPHRAPAVWIDEVGTVTETRGESFVKLKANAAYMSDGKLRRSSLIEFIAQSFGYQQAAQAVREGRVIEKASKAFLVSVTKCKLSETAALKADDTLKISIEDIHNVGPITLFNSVVTDSRGTEYARASLKVFSQN
jgi:predicted hotdog family 3-hydroxylacyl-ACP dehydratase